MTQHIRKQKHLEIANYPPPYDGWGTHTKFVVDEIRRRGHECAVLKINEGRKTKSPEYTDVQNGLDYLLKVIQFAGRGYSINVHVNAEAPKGYLLALIAVLIGRAFFRTANITFQGGLPQTYFPRPRRHLWFWKFKFLFHLASGVLCDSFEIKTAIVGYGIAQGRVGTAAGYSAENLKFKPQPLTDETESFLHQHSPVFFCYVSYRPEYRLEVLREGMKLFRQSNPNAGFIWLGFPKKELPLATEFVDGFAPDERSSIHLLGTVTHDEFLTLLLRCTAKLRTPACDGVSASVLESLALGMPVVASENGRRPPGVLTYSEMDAEGMCARLTEVVANRDSIVAKIRLDPMPDNVALAANWLVGKVASEAVKGGHVGVE